MPEMMNITVRNKIATKTDNVAYVCGNSDYVINFDFDSEWDAYDTKTARFARDGQYTDVVFTGNQCNVPIITNTYAFHVGVFAGDLHTTTAARVPCRKSILCGSGAPANPTPDVYDQLMELIKGLGGVDPDDIAKAVADYLAAHPIEETDPTVPEWAKAKTKPTYSAAEVGAISQSDLQAATDAALAQAKSSGEFDGPAGPQGPSGAPGKDGAGMDITGATVGQIAKIAAVDASGVPTAWSPVDMPSGGDNETNFQLVFNQECLLDADVSAYEVDIDFGLQDFKEFIALIEYSASTNDVYQDIMTFDGVTIEKYGGATNKGTVLQRVIYAKRTTQTEYMGIHRAHSLGIDWPGGNVSSTLSYFSDRITPPTGKLEIWRTNSAEATTITIKLYKR